MSSSTENIVKTPICSSETFIALRRPSLHTGAPLLSWRRATCNRGNTGVPGRRRTRREEVLTSGNNCLSLMIEQQVGWKSLFHLDQEDCIERLFTLFSPTPSFRETGLVMGSRLIPSSPGCSRMMFEDYQGPGVLGLRRTRPMLAAARRSRLFPLPHRPGGILVHAPQARGTRRRASTFRGTLCRRLPHETSPRRKSEQKPLPSRIFRGRSVGVRAPDIVGVAR